MLQATKKMKKKKDSDAGNVHPNTVQNQIAELTVNRWMTVRLGCRFIIMCHVKGGGEELGYMCRLCFRELVVSSSVVSLIAAVINQC